MYNNNADVPHAICLRQLRFFKVFDQVSNRGRTRQQGGSHHERITMSFEYLHKLKVFTTGGCCCWFDAQAIFTSFNVSFMSLTSFKSSLMRFTASSNVEDSHDALSSTVDCASTDSIAPPIAATTNARQNFFHIVY